MKYDAEGVHFNLLFDGIGEDLFDLAVDGLLEDVDQLLDGIEFAHLLQGVLVVGLLVLRLVVLVDQPFVEKLVIACCHDVQ